MRTVCTALLMVVPVMTMCSELKETRVFLDCAMVTLYAHKTCYKSETICLMVCFIGK